MAYVTIADYLKRYGERETILITNEDAAAPSPTYDSAKVQAALDDMTDFADGYIGNSYRTPLVDPPRVVQSIVAALAREALHNTRVPQDVRDDADRARSQLKDISAGRMTLPVADGDVPPEANVIGDPAASNDAPCPTFTNTTLSGYMDPFTGGSQRACWKGGG